MPTILLVEDNQAIRKLFKKIFIKSGHDILESDGNGNTIQIYESNRPDIVIINNNFEIIEEIRAIDPSSKIIILTGDPRIDKEKMYSWGIQVRVKPIRISELMFEIKAITTVPKIDDKGNSEPILETTSQTSGRNRLLVQDSQETKDYEKT